MFSLSTAFAEDSGAVSSNMTSSADAVMLQNVSLLQSSQAKESLLSATNNAIEINVIHHYDETANTWDEDGYELPNATIELYDSDDNLISTHKTDEWGEVVIDNLNPGKYYVVARYADFEPQKSEILDFTQDSGTFSGQFDFIPDIFLLVDYGSHKEKLGVLMNLSKRVAFISTMDYDESREWLAEYARFIHIDMFAEGSYSVFTADKLRKLLKDSPANYNYNVAYTFGVYSESIKENIGIHIVGANPNNNTYHTIENTYVGSYFQAEDIEASDVLINNMKNYLKYIYYLINPSEYENPTLNVSNAPQMGPESGFYHPDLGIFTIYPEGDLINKWILNNPGYDCDGIGSLNWMIQDYSRWFNDILDPTTLFKQFEDNFTAKFNPDKKFIAIATYYCGGDVVDSLIRGYEAYGRPAFNIFKFSTDPSMSSIINRINKVSKVGISAITSLYSWSLSYANGSAEPDLSEIDLEVLKGVNEISKYSYESELGPQIEWTYAVTYPSFEGVFGPVILSYLDEENKVQVIQTGVDKMVKLSCGWADLKDMNNSDKTIAIVLYNYPPGKAEIGASYLDVIQSTYDLILKLYEEGYTVCNISEVMNITEFARLIFNSGNKGSWAGGLLDQFVQDNKEELIKHHQLISIDDFNKLVKDLPEDLRFEMANQWGAGLGKSMVYTDTDDNNKKYLVIPGFWLGNIFVTFQPSRGWEEADIEEVIQNYHDLKLPPHQQYVAFYEWMDKITHANAIVSMGTHGTLEWLPGKNIGVGSGDWSFELTLTPTLYPYIVSNPGEAMVARDRSASMLITHMTPAMVSSGLYGNYTVLNNYITYYKDQIKLNVTSNADVYKEKIIDLAPQLGFRNYTTNESFDDWLDDLHLYLEGMGDDFMTYGLHTLGKILADEELAEEVITVTTSQTKIYNHIMEFLYPELKGKDYYNDIQNDLGYLDEHHAIKEFLSEYIGRLVNGSSVDELSQIYGIEVNSSLYNSTKYAASVIVNIQNNNEWNAILTALEGGYVPAGLFADPAYGDSIPTGYDGYASDSTRMPSEAAYESSVKIVNLLLANYYEQHGSWPELTALILWGTEISRTEGIGIAEFLYLLGCKPVWSENGKVIGVERIPLEDLTVTLNNGTVVNRPRVDVFASLVTSNKDWITWMVKGVNLAASADGESYEDNFVKKHYAENPTLDRLFGLPGNILEGTGMSTLIPNTADWDIETVNEKAMSIYLESVSFAWNLDDDGNIVINKEKDTFVYLLNKTDLITQNLDSTWRVLDSDDYYDWFGGLYNAASLLKEQSGQERPDTSFVDIRDKNRYVAKTYEAELEFEIRTTLLNPKYLAPLIGNAAGMNSIAARYQNMFGTLTVANNKLQKELGNQLTDSLLNIAGSVGDETTSVGLQSSLAHMFYLADQGTWDADSSKMEAIANEYMNQVIQYGVACCHHTCKNLEFNMKIIQASSLSPAMKQQYADILAQATKTEPLYQMDENDNPSSSDGTQSDDASSAHELVNGTTQTESDLSGGRTSAGLDPSTPGDAKSASESQSSSQSSSSAGDAGAKAYELSQSASKSVSSEESNMSIFVIIAIIVLIAIFLVGYVRNQKDDYDDY
ncbi:cobaltochelatase subunit CobN [Methanobrevibacter sp.]|uniref:cobaltochelatase subunit CobN n=1 Tax=Methanobrevibacter sp. TaxID=66852 RepID=UPI0025F54D44|nr:cobaltochelatase subunit CobN [Methanobrevibacter sp.]MBQ6512215.1 cobaltochelatase subunit CobN [Methanobrevibacter sp.]